MNKDILYIAHRLKILEDQFIKAESDIANIITLINALLKELLAWNEFMTTEFLKQSIVIHKNERKAEYHRQSLKEHFKQTYDNFEALFNAIKKRTYKRYINK